MLFIQGSPVIHARPNLNDSELSYTHPQDSETYRSTGRSEIPTCPSAIDTSSTSTGASPDEDTSTESPDWNGNGPLDGSLPSQLDVSVKVFPPSGAFESATPSTISDCRAQSMTGEKMANIPPKVEELDDDDLQSVRPSEVGNPAGAPVVVPRKRGRPRKHPLPALTGQVKVTKGRSKTGCITCRRRKKKCDETKPA